MCTVEGIVTSFNTRTNFQGFHERLCAEVVGKFHKSKKRSVYNKADVQKLTPINNNQEEKKGDKERKALYLYVKQRKPKEILLMRRRGKERHAQRNRTPLMEVSQPQDSVVVAVCQARWPRRRCSGHPASPLPSKCNKDTNSHSYIGRAKIYMYEKKEGYPLYSNPMPGESAVLPMPSSSFAVYRRCSYQVVVSSSSRL